MKKIILVILLVLLIAGGFWLIKNRNATSSNGKPKITASFYPYYFFTKEIVGDKFNVINITPTGAEPHDYEPTPQDVINMQESKLLIINGLVEPWANRITNAKIVKTGDTLFKNNDPHVWLSLKLAQKQIGTILEAIKTVDPGNGYYYTTNANKLVSDIKNLDNQFTMGFSKCQVKTFITAHEAFSYLAKDYGLTELSIAGLTPDAEPSLQQLSTVARQAQENKVKYIFFESLVSPKLANTLASEIGAKTLVLNPLEGLTSDQTAKGANYETIMSENLSNLKTALQCE